MRDFQGLCGLESPPRGTGGPRHGSRGNQPAGTDPTATFEEHRLLGVVIQALYEQAEVGRAELFEDAATATAWGDGDSLQIVMQNLSTDELSRIWDAGELAYQLSAAYIVRVLRLDPLDVMRTGPVKAPLALLGGCAGLDRPCALPWCALLGQLGAAWRAHHLGDARFGER
jgi:hypothetical protein